MDELKHDDQNKETTEQSSLVEECQKELELVKARYLYLNAEFDNYKKRIEKDRLTWMESAQDVLLLDILTVYDDVERALRELESAKLPAEALSHLAGFELIAKGISKIIKTYTIEEIPFSKVFDPEKNDAIMQVASEGSSQGEVVSVLEKGYIRKGRVLRPSKVSVAA